VQWTVETVITPGQTYMGSQSERCWAVDVGYSHANKAYYFYFSNGGSDFGVMKATNPALSDAVDQLKRPLATHASVGNTTVPYDPTVLIDDDDCSTAYIVFGLHEQNSPYLIAQLNVTMQGFAEKPKPVVFLPSPADNSTMRFNDKSTLHKRGSLYYLSAGTDYSTAGNIYGPYMYRGNTGPSARTGERSRNYGLTTQAHGRYFTWNGQWFHVYCEFIDQNNTVAVAASAATAETVNEAAQSATVVGSNADAQQGIGVALLPCAAPGSPVRHGARWKSEAWSSSKTIFVSEDVFTAAVSGQQHPVCIDLSHPAHPPVGVVYAFPCTNAANEQWHWNEPSGRLQSAEFPTMCLGASQALDQPFMVTCGSAPMWSYNNITGELSMKSTATAPSSKALCMTITGSNPPSPPPNRPDYHRYRDSWMTYTHYRENGEMVDDVKFLDQDAGRLGVGQYDARWERIEAEWFMNATNTNATQSLGSVPLQVELAASISGTNASAALFGVVFPPQDKDGPRPLLAFPHMMHVPQQACVVLQFDRCPQGGKVSLSSYSTLFAAHSDAVDVGSYTCPPNAGLPFTATVQYHVDPAAASLYFTYNSDNVAVGGGSRAMVLDWFNLTLTPVLTPVLVVQ
jgi:hypothetical protein